MKTLIVVPVLARPQRVQPLIDSIAAATTLPHRVLFVANRSDLAELDAIKAARAEVLIVPDAQGSYCRKVNAAYRQSEEPLLFLAADDLAFHPGWLEAAHARLDGTTQVVGTNDLGNPRVLAGEHSTHSLVTRAYCDDPGATADQPRTVLYEGYRHWYCDDELVQVARARGVFTAATDSHVEHLHPFFGKADDDDTYRLGTQRKARDQRVFQRRSRIWKAVTT